MAMKASFVEEMKGVLARSDLHQIAALPKSTDDRLSPSEELAASVVSVCFPKDSNSTSLHQNNEDLMAQRQNRREKEAVRKRIYHQRLKDERNNLRKTVDELSLQLQELQQGKQSTRPLSLIDSVWRDLAMEERHKLLSSETEQKQLLAAAEAKASCIRELCAQLPGQSTISTKQEGSVATSRPPFDYTMYRGHLRRVNESYTQVDEIFASLVEGIVNSVNRREIDGEVEYFEHRNNFTEPFNYAHTQRTMWQLAKLDHRQLDREDFGNVAASDDMFVIRFRLAETLASGSTVSLLQRYVVRRFEEAARTVLVWKTHSEGEGVFQGMHSDETGWVCIQPSTLEEGATKVMVCIRQAPVSFSVSSSGDARVGQFHQMLQNTVTEDMAQVTSELDKLLLEDTLAGIDI